jgi:hypothetical protein
MGNINSKELSGGTKARAAAEGGCCSTSSGQSGCSSSSSAGKEPEVLE